MKDKKNYKRVTRLMHAGLAPEDYHGIVNPPITMASTILIPTLKDYEDPDYPLRYARYGTPLSNHFEGAIAELEGGYAAISTPSGLSAITTSVLSFIKTGDHILVSDSLYPPARLFFDGVLTRMDIEVEYYNPLIGAKIEEKLRKNTAIIYMETPGSATFEVIDVPAITAVARKKNIFTICDNSWSSGWVFNPLKHGADLVLLSASKYIGGHADLMLGAVVASTEKVYKALKQCAKEMGVCAGANEMYLALRGLRTLPVRMEQNAANAMVVAQWLEKHPMVQKVYYPALKGHAGHEVWKRDFAGANGLLSLLLVPADKEAVRAFAESLEFFPMGSSWGAYESLLQPQYPATVRTAVPWKEEGALMRLHVGLEDPEDLIADLEQALEKFGGKMKSAV